jgi:hypothetical protein
MANVAAIQRELQAATRPLAVSAVNGGARRAAVQAGASGARREAGAWWDVYARSPARRAAAVVAAPGAATAEPTATPLSVQPSR